MSIKVVNDTNNGSATLKAPNVAGDFTITAPNRSMTMAGVDEVIGVNQTWQNVTASRVSGITYTNTTGKPIYIQITDSASSGNNGTIHINGALVAAITEGADSNQTFGVIVPNGNTYVVSLVSINYWLELR